MDPSNILYSVLKMVYMARTGVLKYCAEPSGSMNAKNCYKFLKEVMKRDIRNFNVFVL